MTAAAGTGSARLARRHRGAWDWPGLEPGARASAESYQTDAASLGGRTDAPRAAGTPGEHSHGGQRLGFPAEAQLSPGAGGAGAGAGRRRPRPPGPASGSALGRPRVVGFGLSGSSGWAAGSHRQTVVGVRLGHARCRGLSPPPSAAIMKDSGDSKDQQLMVALRVRPISVAELEEGATLIAHKVDEQMVVLMDPMEDPDDILRAHRSREKSYLFDVAFDFTATQEMVYQATTKSLIEGVISGYNATVFAYGPTGCGKTYTMLGTDHEPGIYVRTLNDLFRAIEETSNDMEYEVSMSYLEIYNEMIRDLLNPALGYLELREDSKGVIQVAGITEVSTINAKEASLVRPTQGHAEDTRGRRGGG
ncbi:Hypothetical predicted protein [Marmota monax]|uniref:Kinesin motor domain-containing protein n=1 Tax=Marmota monax TaxID=9995 RepID=A0A5E4CIC9_MARMO|nr:Hypothetical predicted protein [Marmota monax]